MRLNISVQAIETKQTNRWLLEKHYARRKCSRSFCFGLFVDGILEGVVTYGTPPSSPLRKGICGSDFASVVLELNRLCINSTAPKNAASILVGRSLRLLPKKGVVISYADINQGHIGYVYQATNWIYTGLSAKRTDWKLRGLEHLHGQTIADISRGRKNRAQYMRDKFGDAFYLAERPRKHRYVFFTDKKLRKHLRYSPQPYPKGESKRYECIDIRED